MINLNCKILNNKLFIDHCTHKFYIVNKNFRNKIDIIYVNIKIIIIEIYNT